MKRAEAVISLCASAVLVVILSGCGGSGSSNFNGGNTVNNTLPVTVNAGPQNVGDVDVLFASVTICAPGTSDCQTIPNVQVDTGSEGLRLLASQVNLSLPAENDASAHPLGNCITFADMSYVWGPVVKADIQLAGEKASSVPIQLIGASNFPSVPSACGATGPADNTVAALGATGLLGVGVFRQDCGQGCTSTVSQKPPVYFSCPSSGCSVAGVPLSEQLQNPVWMFPQDNNGLLITLPSVPANGAPTVSGSLIFGIGTQSDNSIGSATTFTTDAQGNFSTNFKGTSYSNSYIDSGSNGLFILSSTQLGIPVCTGSNTSFYCPPSPTSFSATINGQNGATATVPFTIANAQTLFSTVNTAFTDLGGPSSQTFDWGLPFFFGRSVFIGIEGQSALGPYYAF